MVLDSVLPDLEVGEFARQMRSRHPVMDLLRVDAGRGRGWGAQSAQKRAAARAAQAQEDVCETETGETPAWAMMEVAAVAPGAMRIGWEEDGSGEGAG